MVVEAFLKDTYAGRHKLTQTDPNVHPRPSPTAHITQMSTKDTKSLVSLITFSPLSFSFFYHAKTPTNQELFSVSHKQTCTYKCTTYIQQTGNTHSGKCKHGPGLQCWPAYAFLFNPLLYFVSLSLKLCQSKVGTNKGLKGIRRETQSELRIDKNELQAVKEGEMHKRKIRLGNKERKTEASILMKSEMRHRQWM